MLTHTHMCVWGVHAWVHISVCIHIIYAHICTRNMHMDVRIWALIHPYVSEHAYMYVHLPVCRLGKTQGFLVILIKVLSNKLNCLKACSQCAYMQQTHTHQCKFAMRIYQNPMTNNTSTNKNHPLDMDTGAQVVTCRQPAGYAALRLHNGGRDMLLLVLPLGRARCETADRFFK